VLESLALHLAAAARLQAHSAHVTVPAEALARGLRLSYRGLRDGTAGIAAGETQSTHMARALLNSKKSAPSEPYHTAQYNFL